MGEIAHQQKSLKNLGKKRYSALKINNTAGNQQYPKESGNEVKNINVQNPPILKEKNSLTKTKQLTLTQVYNNSRNLINIESSVETRNDFEISTMYSVSSDPENSLETLEEAEFQEDWINSDIESQEEINYCWNQESAIIEKIAYQQTVGGLWVPHMVLREEGGSILWIPVIDQLMMWISPQQFCAKCGQIVKEEESVKNDMNPMIWIPPPKIALCKDCQEDLDGNLQGDCKELILEQIKGLIMNVQSKAINTAEFNPESIRKPDIEVSNNSYKFEPSLCKMCNMVEKCYGTYAIIFRLDKIQPLLNAKDAVPNQKCIKASGWIAIIPQDKIQMDLQLRGSQGMIMFTPETHQGSKMENLLGIVKCSIENGIGTVFQQKNIDPKHIYEMLLAGTEIPLEFSIAGIKNNSLQSTSQNEILNYIGNEVLAMLNCDNGKFIQSKDISNCTNPWIGIVYSDGKEFHGEWMENKETDISNEWQNLAQHSRLNREEWIEIEGKVDDWNGTRVKWKSIQFSTLNDCSYPNYPAKYQGILDLEHWVGHRVRRYGDCYNSE